MKVIKSNILLPLLEDSYRQEYTEYGRKNLRLSDAGCAAPIGEKCERQIFYDMRANDKKSLLSSASLVMFDDGRIHEQDIRRRLRLIMRSPEREVTDPETGARGKIDNTIYAGAIAKDVKQQHNIDLDADPGLEIKSVNEYQYKEMAEKEIIQQSYYDQIQAYLWITKLPFFFCLIKNRNSMGKERGEMPYLEFIVFPDEARQKEIITGLKITKEVIDKDIMPPRPFLRESSQCQFCRFKHICWDPEVEQAKIERFKEGEIPQPEVFETAMKTYGEINRQIAELERFQEETKAVILQYFKATGSKESIVSGIKATYNERTTKVWDYELLRQKLSKDQLLAIAEPSEEKIKKLIADHQLDAKILEDVITKAVTGYTLRITELKEKTADRQSIPQIGKGESKDGPVKRSRSNRASIKADRKPGKGSRAAKQRKNKLLKTAKAKQRNNINPDKAGEEGLRTV